MQVPGLLTRLMACAAIAAGPVATAGSSSAAVSNPVPSLEVGQPFPEIVLPSLGGEPMSISSFRGTKVAMHVWASW